MWTINAILGADNSSTYSFQTEHTTKKDGHDSENHENVLDAESQNQTVLGNIDQETSKVFSSTVPICRNVPARVHVVVRCKIISS